MRALIFLRDWRVRCLVVSSFRRAGWLVGVEDDEEEAARAARRRECDLLVMGGCRASSRVFEFRRAWRVGLLALVMGGLGGGSDALAVGADETVSVPFDIHELVVRGAGAVCRANDVRSPVALGQLLVDLHEHTVSVSGRRVALSPLEMSLLEVFVLRSGTVLNRDDILDRLYGVGEPRILKCVDVRVSALRRKLAAAADGESYIETVRGRGYMLRDGPLPAVEAGG